MSVENTAPTGLAAGAPGMPIRFGGSGSEYFRIWIVNVLLTLVTIGLYLPWAKVRRLRYFYGNTTIGDHSFDFHGDPKKMLRGMLLVGAMLLSYSLAGHLSAIAGLIAFLIVAAIWPALFRTSMRFRLANTSWRGMRFRFTGDLAGAYRAMLPVFVPGVGFVAIGAMTGLARDGVRQTPSVAFAAVFGLTMLAVLALSPLIFWLVKRYQHGHYAFGQVETELRSGPGSFYALFFKIIGVALLMGVLVSICVGVIAGGAAVVLGSGRGGNVGLPLAFAIGGALGYLFMIALTYPFATSRSQNLAWGKTAGGAIRFESDLRFWPLVWLTLKNGLLMIVTIGLYWPFARVAVTRMRLQAMRVHLAMPPDDLSSPTRNSEDDATGDAAGDFFGFDIGL